LIPLCRYSKDIKFELKGCTNKIHKNLINYLNCKTIDGDGIQKSVQCNFITYSSIKGYIAILFSLSITVVEIILIILTIMYISHFILTNHIIYIYIYYENHIYIQKKKKKKKKKKKINIILFILLYKYINFIFIILYSIYILDIGKKNVLI